MAVAFLPTKKCGSGIPAVKLHCCFQACEDAAEDAASPIAELPPFPERKLEP